MTEQHTSGVAPESPAMHFTEEEARRGYAMRAGVKAYCCYGMYSDVGHSKGCKYADVATDKRIGDWMQTASGRQFWPLDPRPDEVHLEDIAASLANQCRFGGHCNGHYSVAQHSVYVSHQVPAEHALCALLHDATEAYCVDVPRPLKAALVGYAEIEAKLWRAVALRFNLPADMPECVKVADDSVLLAEKNQRMKRSPAPWSVPGEPAAIRVAYWTPDQARSAFLDRFNMLTAYRL